MRAGQLIRVLQMVITCQIRIADRDLPVSVDVSSLGCGCSAHTTSTASILDFLDFRLLLEGCDFIGAWRGCAPAAPMQAQRWDLAAPACLRMHALEWTSQSVTKSEQNRMNR